MKKLRRTVSAALMALLLIGCTAKTELTEPEVTIPEETAPQVTEAPAKLPTAVPEGMTPTTASEESKLASETVATEPEETVPTVKVEESAPKKAEKPVTKPQVMEPKETTPNQTVPAETQPKATEPPVTEVTAPPTTEAPETEPTLPPATEPPVTVPPVTEPQPTKPTPTETVPEETAPEETVPTELPAEVIDTAALESYGRSYASSTYGYNGTSACTPGTGAGYFPAATKEITSREDGRSYVRQAIDSQYKRDKAYGYLPYEEVDGKTVRCPINVSVSSAGGNTYTITVYYGGTA